jgi:creatinine amidohydrolase
MNGWRRLNWPLRTIRQANRNIAGLNMRLEYARWPDLAGLKERIFVVPLGSLEQHGPHLPLFTDSLIISNVTERVEKLRSERIVVLPVQWLGHSPHHRRFGCVSLDLQPYIDLIRGICRSLINLGVRKIFLLNGHGGNDIPCKAAQRELKSEFEELRDLYIVYATYWNLAAEEFGKIRSSPEGGMGHACEMETSALLASDPDLVDMSKAARGGPGPEMGYRKLDMLKSPAFSLINDFDELSPSGVLGMPELATPEKGARFLEAAAQAVVKLIDEMAEWNFQEQTAPPTAGNPA